MARARRDELDGLFEVPPDEFVRARNALAVRLEESGRPADARTVKRLRKPNTTVWTVNQLARRDPQLVRRLVAAVDRLKTSQRARQEVAEAVAEQRAALHDAVGRATDIMEEAGLSRSPNALERISRTLVGAAADRQASADLLRGRLTREHEPPGFDILAGRGPKPVHGPSSAPPRAARDDRARAAKASRAALRRVRGLQRVAARRQREADRAAKTVDALRQRLHALERHAAETRAAADAAAQEVRRFRAHAGGS